MNRYKQLFESPSDIYFLRATDMHEVQSGHFGNYWRFFKDLKDLNNLIKSNELYVAKYDTNNRGLIIGKGNINELELSYNQLNDEFHSKEIHFPLKDLFDKDYAPSSKILYVGKLIENPRLKR